MTILGIDTSGKTAAVAVCRDNEILCETNIVTKLTHSEVILPILKKMLLISGISLSELDGIAVADGPGSYTGLRIGISLVKALCYATGKPCAGISTLEGLAYNMRGINAKVCAVMKARQNLVYSSMFCIEGNNIERLSEDRIINIEELFNELININEEIYLVGDGAKLIAENFNRENIKEAPCQMTNQRAASVCFAAMEKEFTLPEKVNAKYLQKTQAEKIRMGLN